MSIESKLDLYGLKLLLSLAIEYIKEVSEIDDFEAWLGQRIANLE